MSDGSVKRVQAKSRDTVEDVCERVREKIKSKIGCYVYYVAVDRMSAAGQGPGSRDDATPRLLCPACPLFCPPAPPRPLVMS